MTEMDVSRQIDVLQHITRTLDEHHDAGGVSLPPEDSFLGLPGAVSTHDARLAALNLLEDAIAARRAEERETLGRARAEQSARDSEEFFRRALQEAPIPVIMHTADGTIVEVSSMWTELSGYGPPQVVTFVEWLSLACGVEAPIIERRIMEVFTSPHVPLQTELQITTAAGDRRRWALSWSAPSRLQHGQPYAVGMALDITDRSLAEAVLRRSETRLRQARRSLERRVAERTRELAMANRALESELAERGAANAHIKALVQRLVNIQEEERRSIARDIHDHIGQQMTALRLNVELMLKSAASAAAPTDDAARVLRLSEELDRSVDFLTWQLRPPTVDNLPLAASLAQLTRDWSERFGFDVGFAGVRGLPLQFSPEVQTHLYRIVQEALHNAYKHASATEVHVELALDQSATIIVVRDNGRGFDASTSAATLRHAHSGLGLVGMRERATLIGGEVHIESARDQGTSVRVHVPLTASIWSR